MNFKNNINDNKLLYLLTQMLYILKDDREWNRLYLKPDFPELKLLKRGKVRDIYDLDDKILLVATDRISAFDVIMPNPIPQKGKILTQISLFWLKIMEPIVPNHLITSDVKDYPKECRQYSEILRDRSMLVKKANHFRSNVLSEDISPDQDGILIWKPGRCAASNFLLG